MIQLKSFRIALEKDAAFKGPAEAIGKGISGAAVGTSGLGKFLTGLGKFFTGTGYVAGKIGAGIYHHPVASTIGAISVGSLIGAAALANKTQGIYNLVNEQRKRNIMLNQNNLLQQIANANNMHGKQSDMNSSFAVEPLA
jgi:hypothetical protein